MASAKMDLKQIQHMIHLLREQVPKKMHMEGSVHGLIQEVRFTLQDLPSRRCVQSKLRQTLTLDPTPTMLPFCIGHWKSL